MTHKISKKAILLSIGLILFGYYLFEIRDEIVFPSSLSLPWLLLILFLNLLTLVIKTVRWHVLLSSNGIRLRKMELFSAVSAGFFLGLVTPGTSGEMGRVFTVDIKKTIGFNTVLLEKFFDLGMMALSIFIGAVLYFMGGAYSLIVVIAVLTLVVFLVYSFPRWGGTVIRGFLTGLSRKIPPLQRGVGGDLLESCKEVSRLHLPPALSVFSFLVSGLLLGIAGIQFAVIVHLLGYSPSAETIILGFFLPYLAGLLSFIPMSLGVLEWSSPALLEGLFHISRDAGNMSVLLYRISVTLPLVVFGFICFGIRVFLKRHRVGKNPAPAEGRSAERVS